MGHRHNKAITTFCEPQTWILKQIFLIHHQISGQEEWFWGLLVLWGVFLMFWSLLDPSLLQSRCLRGLDHKTQPKFLLFCVCFCFTCQFLYNGRGSVHITVNYEPQGWWLNSTVQRHLAAVASSSMCSNSFPTEINKMVTELKHICMNMSGQLFM